MRRERGKGTKRRYCLNVLEAQHGFQVLPIDFPFSSEVNFWTVSSAFEHQMLSYQKLQKRFLLHFRCKGEEFTMDCFANSTWLPQVELQCKECQGEECDGSEKSEWKGKWSLTISCFPIESESAAVAKFYFQSHVGFCLPLNCVKF